MIVYHATRDQESVTAILEHGFKDASDTYLTSTERSGIWLSDQPLLAGNGGLNGDEPLLRLEIPESTLSEYEWIEDGKSYREWLVPADIVNSYGPPKYVGNAME